MRKYDLYWKTNAEWYDYADEEGTKPILTDAAPPDAVESFNRYWEQKAEDLISRIFNNKEYS